MKLKNNLMMKNTKHFQCVVIFIGKLKHTEKKYGLNQH